MQSNDLSAYLAPFKLLINKNALSATYRTLELDGGVIRGCAGFGMLEVYGDFGLPDGPLYVDATTFIAVVDSLPADKPLVLNAENANVLAWEAGAAKGRLALNKIPEMPRIGEMRPANEAWHPTQKFIETLRLGALSCGSESLASIGMYGVVIDSTGDVCVYSSDNVTISCAFMSDTTIQAPPIQTYSPEAIKLLAAVLNPKDKEAAIYFGADGIYYRDSYMRLALKQLAPMKADVNAILNEFSIGDTRAPLPVDRLQAFIKRINAMTENKKANSITMQASNGRLTMSFSDGLAASEEYYMVDELTVPDLPPIQLDATKVGRALAHVDSVVLDHIERKVLVFEGGDPLFQYIVSGKS